MTAALHRLVFAVMHHVFRPTSDEEWAQLWQRPDLRTDAVTKFFHEERDSFDLFHPDRPFMQSKSLAEVEPAGIARLVPFRASGNNVTLFDHTTAADRLTLTPAEAARWLVTLQCYDPGGMKSGAYRNAPRSSKRAPINDFGCVVVEGGTLKETLLLNLLRYDPARDEPSMTGVDDRPNWQDPGSTAATPNARTPRGWLDLLTWPSRRVLLRASTEQSDAESGHPLVDGVVITPGTELRPVAEDHEHDWMAALRIPITKGPRKTGKKKPIMPPRVPVRLEEQRGVWRHAEELLLGAQQHNDQSRRRRPAALDQIAERAEHNLIPADAVFTLRVYGQQLDDKQAIVHNWQEESVPAPVALLREKSARLRLSRVVGLSCRLADDVGFLVRQLDRGYRADFNASPPPTLEVSYWPHLTAPFHTFVRDLGKAMEMENNGAGEKAAVDKWGRAVRGIAADAADRWVFGAARSSARALSMAGKHDIVFRAELSRVLKLFSDEVDRSL
ncbi:CRISPR system Cascade subunit CasA [Actinoalloteichus hymeniacidonis]|nr:CRISPR system Cascade subunit CasA [Actinoalloteichus hymeniacidonis]